jgi:hypothetical protein
MEVLQYSIAIFLILVAVILILLRQGRKNNQFIHSLYGWLGLQAAGLLSSFLIAGYVATEWLLIVLQIVAWGILLWGWVWIGG